MSDLKQGSTLNRKNKKNLALKSPPVKAPAPSAGDSQIPGALGNNDARTDTLEIGVEFKLDLRNEDLQVLKELGAGNGGTVSKVMHTATKVVMAKKVGRGEVCWLAKNQQDTEAKRRSFTWKQRKRPENKSFGSYTSCMTAPRPIS